VECSLRISTENRLSWLRVFVFFYEYPQGTATTTSFKTLSNYLFTCNPTSLYISGDNSSSVNEALFPHQHMFHVNINIIVQNIQLLGINGCVENSIVLMIAVYEDIYSYYITSNYFWIL
jgi:hypothetical protein